MPEERDQDTKTSKGSRRRRASAKKKQAERKKVTEGAKLDKPSKTKERKSRPVRKKAERRKASTRSEEDRPKRTRKRGPQGGRRRPRKDRRQDAEPIGELTEPEQPPRPELDLAGELEPAWELGVPVGGGLCLLSVGLAIAAMLTARPQGFSVAMVGLLLLLLAIAGGGVGVLARKVWGYILALGSTGLGTIAGLLWAVNSVVTPDLSPWLPLFFFVCNVAAVLFLYQMRWGPGFMADERDRYRAMKRNLASYTTAHGELAHAGAIAAVLASLMGGLLLMGAHTTTSSRPSMPANFADGMQLQEITEAPEEGSVVLARWGREDYFFLGRVDQRRGDDEYHITYLDGDEAWVRQSDLRQDGVRAGASVHIHVQGHEGWLPARITQRANNRVEADIGPQRVWVPLAMVRVREL